MAGRLFCLVILSSCFQLSLSRILLFWAVDSSERTQETVQANVEHVKNLGIDHDVILAHYRGSRRDWDQKWYREHVTKSLSGTGFKFHFLQRAYKAGDWEERYEFVWALDSDIDLSKADLRQFLEMARHMNSAIVGPTFVEKGGMSLAQDGGSVIRREGHSPKRHTSHHGHQLSGPNKIQVPNPGCDFRHTDFVELTAPLLKSAVLRSILVDCKHCIHDKSDWGLDMMWCKYLSERLGEQGCALVDKTPVVHLDWGLAPVSAEFYTALHAVQAKYGNYWSQHRVLDCKHQEAGLVENIAEETVQDTSTKRKSTKRVKKKTHRLSAVETVKKGGSADASRRENRENPNERDSQEQEELDNDDEEVVDGDGEESVDQEREEGKQKPTPRKAGREQSAETEDPQDSMNKPLKANKKTSEQEQTVSNASSEATEKIQPAKEAKTTVTDEDEEEAEEVDQEESSESSESSDSKIRSNVTSASSANTSNKQAVSNSSSEATQKVTDEDEEEAEEVDQEESSESSESSDSKIRSNVTSASSANTSNKQAVSNSSSEATQKVTDEDEEEAEVDQEESSESSESSDSKIRSNVTNSQGSKSSEDESKQDESEPASEGIFKVKAKAPQPESHERRRADAVFDDGAQPQKAPGLPTHLDGKMAVLGTVAGPKEPAIQLSSVDAKGHIEPFEVKARRRAEAPWHTAKLEESFKEAELRLRDDIKQLRELEEEFKLSTERSERKHHRKRRAKTHKHSAIEKAVSLIDMEEHKLEPDQNQDSPSLQIKALAAGARQVAMEVAEEVQNTVGSMSSEQLQSTRNAALQSVQAAITEQVETQELHKDKPNANRHEVSLARKIRELEAQVAWDQKQMDHEMEEELGLKNQLKHIEGELRARKIASNMAVKDPHAKTTQAQRTEETGKMHKKKSQHRKSHGVKLANHRKQS